MVSFPATSLVLIPAALAAVTLNYSDTLRAMQKERTLDDLLTSRVATRRRSTQDHRHWRIAGLSDRPVLRAKESKIYVKNLHFATIDIVWEKPAWEIFWRNTRLDFDEKMTKIRKEETNVRGILQKDLITKDYLKGISLRDREFYRFLISIPSFRSVDWSSRNVRFAENV